MNDWIWDGHRIQLSGNILSKGRYVPIAVKTGSQKSCFLLGQTSGSSCSVLSTMADGSLLRFQTVTFLALCEKILNLGHPYKADALPLNYSFPQLQTYRMQFPYVQIYRIICRCLVKSQRPKQNFQWSTDQVSVLCIVTCQSGISRILQAGHICLYYFIHVTECELSWFKHIALLCIFLQSRSYITQFCY